MTPIHDSFTLKRRLPARPATVFAAWSDPAVKRRRFVDSDGPGWSTSDYALDFRVGGRETGSFVLAEGPGRGTHANVTHYLDIAAPRRIVDAYTMAHDGAIHSASLATVEFLDEAGETLLRHIEQGVYHPSRDGVAGRQKGWTHLLSALDASLRQAA